ncbi:hypothetical protein FBU30_007370 [Linnemannia zychae]|nr:hypothetical protein FBU30_007370 [Linnemannia zychae]
MENTARITKRTLRQDIGRKADGMILGTSTGLGICALEAAKKENRPRSTKALQKTLKIAKFSKDMVDIMRAKVPQAESHKSVAYGLRIATRSMCLYTLQQRPGRFDQLFYENNVEFPPIWNANTAEVINIVIGQVMALRKELKNYSTNLARWKRSVKRDSM